MIKTNYQIDPDIAPYVNCIMFGESTNVNSQTSIPLYADGYPGIMFQQSDEGFFLHPKNEKLSELFLYGQTLNPISLDVRGCYHYAVVQLYPFASKYLLDIDPKVLNDDCFDLLTIKYLDVASFHKGLNESSTLAEKIEIILNLIRGLIESHKVHDKDNVQKAISLILKSKGQIRISTLIEELPITERTLERNFSAYVGLSPKQFSKIIQFQFALNQLTETSFEKLTDVSLDSGFTDQSHFIKTFKRYTGQTPSFFRRNL